MPRKKKAVVEPEALPITEEVALAIQEPEDQSLSESTMRPSETRVDEFRLECDRVYSEVIKDFMPRTVMDRERIMMLSRMLVRQQRVYDLLTNFDVIDSTDENAIEIHFKLSSEADRIAQRISIMTNDLRKACPAVITETVDITTGAGKNKVLLDAINGLRAGAIIRG